MKVWLKKQLFVLSAFEATGRLASFNYSSLRLIDRHDITSLTTTSIKLRLNWIGELMSANY